MVKIDRRRAAEHAESSGNNLRRQGKKIGIGGPIIGALAAGASFIPAVRKRSLLRKSLRFGGGSAALGGAAMGHSMHGYGNAYSTVAKGLKGEKISKKELNDYLRQNPSGSVLKDSLRHGMVKESSIPYKRALALAGLGAGTYVAGKKTGESVGIDEGIRRSGKIPVHRNKKVFSRRKQMEKNAKSLSLLSDYGKKLLKGGKKGVKEALKPTKLIKEAPGIFKVAADEKDLLNRIARACELMAQKEVKEAEREEKREKEREAWQEIDRKVGPMRSAKYKAADKLRREAGEKARKLEHEEEKKIRKIENAIRKKYDLPSLNMPVSPSPCY